MNWSDGRVTGPLSRRSFELHARLAEELGKDTGYRRVQTLSVAASAGVLGFPASTVVCLQSHSVRCQCCLGGQQPSHTGPPTYAANACSCLATAGPPKAVKGGKSNIPSWLDTGRVTRLRVMADEDTTAQVLYALWWEHPVLLDS